MIDTTIAIMMIVAAGAEEAITIDMIMIKTMRVVTTMTTLIHLIDDVHVRDHDRPPDRLMALTTDQIDR